MATARRWFIICHVGRANACPIFLPSSLPHSPSYCEQVQQKVHELVEPLSTEQLWTRPYPYGNSIGHLLLHLTGNLNYYIGAQIAGTGYVRDRNREFTETEKNRRPWFSRTSTARSRWWSPRFEPNRPTDWCAPYTSVDAAAGKDRFTVLMRMSAHAYHHVGQMIYLCKELSKTGAPEA